MRKGVSWRVSNAVQVQEEAPDKQGVVSSPLEPLVQCCVPSGRGVVAVLLAGSDLCSA